MRAVIFMVIPMAGFLIGCAERSDLVRVNKAVELLNSGTVTKAEREKAVTVLDEMYTAYLKGTLAEARSNLLKAVDFTQINSVQIPELREALPVAFARLSLLERKAGNEAQSKLYFEKSRSWRIIQREKAGMKPEEIIAEHDGFTQEDSDNYVIEWDRKRTKGKGPAYLNAL